MGDFELAVAALTAAVVRDDVVLREMPAPTRIAPEAHALAGDLSTGAEEPVASGRFVLLHDPVGQPAWAGTIRCVVFVRAEVDDDMAADPLLAGVVWSWLLEALDTHGAAHHSAGGTVTTTRSQRFGSLAAGEPEVSELELRCSWSPLDLGDAAAHLHAFADLLGQAGGVGPRPPGVTMLRPRR